MITMKEEESDYKRYNLVPPRSMLVQRDSLSRNWWICNIEGYFEAMSYEAMSMVGHSKLIHRG